ncbi:protein kinase, partial [Dehalococcoidia bacterium]|nr:protein kinase [Dehalococcoidia bacterium]MCL0088353.1 protein kinase [Dehalococcoidia bacterium]
DKKVYLFVVPSLLSRIIQNLITEANQIGCKIAQPESLHLFEQEEYAKAVEIAPKDISQIKARMADFKEAEKLQKTIQNLITEANQIGCKISQPESLHLFEQGEYAKALEIATKEIDYVRTRINDFKKAEKLQETIQNLITEANQVGCKIARPESLELFERGGEYAKAVEIARKEIPQIKARLNDFNELNSQIKSAESAIGDAKRLGCEVTEAEELLKQARSALSAGNYREGISITKNNIIETKTEERLRDFNELNSQIKSAESAIGDAKRLGCEVTEAEELLKQARSALSAGNYREGITIAKNAIEQSKTLKAGARPEITLHLTKHNFRPNYWEKVDILLKNTGTAHAKAISLSFSKEVEVKGLRELNLNIGDEQRLGIMLMPKNAGQIPLEVDIRYEDLDGEAYDTTSEFILSVGEAETIEEIRPAEFAPRPTTPSTFPAELQPKYRDVEYISKGGFARVFRANRVSDGRTVALKVPLSLDEATGRSFLKEIKAWEELRHENIIQLYDVNIMPIPYFEMEYADKGNLEALSKPVEAEEAARIIFEILSGLKYAHDKGVIHRDLKPQNVLLTGDLTPKISDWGLSKVVAESKSSSITGFSPLYATPEHVAPKQFGRPDPRTDNYQVGVIFYELVTGRLPFEGDSIMEISSAIVGEEPDLPSEINPGAKDVEPIIMKCLQKRKEDRYQSAAELQRALAGYLKVQLTESLKKSRGDLTRSRLFCADLVLLTAKQGDYTEMLKYLSALKGYAKEEEKAEIENVMQGVCHRQKRGIEPGEEILREIEILAKRVLMK